MTSAPVACRRSRSSCWMSSPQSPFTWIGSSISPRPVTASTAEIRPAAKSPCPATSARTPDASLMVFTEIAADLGLVPHLSDQRLVEPLGGVDAAPLQKMVHGDHFGDHGDVLAGIERNGDARDGHAEDVGRLPVEPRALDDGVVTPFLELDDDLDALLLADGPDAEDGRDVDEAEAANLHVMALELVAPSN